MSSDIPFTNFDNALEPYESYNEYGFDSYDHQQTSRSLTNATSSSSSIETTTSQMHRLIDPQNFFIDRGQNPINGSLNSPDDDQNCTYSPNDYLTEKFALVTLFGSGVCIVGFIHNCLLVHILRRSNLIKTHVFYLAILAICDMVTEFSYIALMSVQVLFDYTENFEMYKAWNGYLKVVFTMTHVSLTVATYMIVAASAERYLVSSKVFCGSCTKRHRWFVTFGVCCFAFLSKGLVYWEIEVVYKENCTGFGAYMVQPSSLAMDPPYRVGYTLWFRHIVHVFFPFILLLCLNLAILSRLKRRPLMDRMHTALVQSSMGDVARERKRSIRAATMMLGAIVTTYLISNLLNVVITLWEHIDLEFLQDRANLKFYTFSADTITLLTVFTGAIRFPIYCACNQHLRKELRRLCKSWYKGLRLIGSFGKILCFNANKENHENGDSRTCINEDTIHCSTALTAPV